jgi:rod shape-determining protein MreC
MPLYTPGRRRAIILLLLTSVLLLTLDLRGNAIFDATRNGLTRVLDPLESAADVVTRPVRNAWRGITQYEDIERENEELRAQIDAQRGDQIAAQAVILDHQDLLALNDLPSVGDYPTVAAMVVGESPSNLDQVIEINKGSNDGIEVGMAVVSPAGLVGKVTVPLQPDRARVMLITDERYAEGVKVVPGAPPETTTTAAPPSTVAASAPPPTAEPALSTEPATTTTTVPESTTTVPESTTTTSTTSTTIDLATSRDTGRIRGRGGGQLPQVDLLDDSPVFGRIVVGDIVLTAGGTNGLAPPGIQIGLVRNVVSRSSAEGPLLEVEPVADLDRLNFVTVVLYKPESEVAPNTQAGG